MDGERANRLHALGSATVGETGGAALDRALRPAWAGAALAAPCLTVECAPGDNLAVHAAVADAPPGVALVVEVPSDREHGFWGEVLTVAAQARDVVGLVIHACTRDTAAIESRRFPLFSTGFALPGASKRGPGQVGGPIVIDGVMVRTGDWIVADVDGVVVVPALEVDETIHRGEERHATEEGLFVQLDSGATTVELLALDPTRVTRAD
jgi:4-hydroxy-4-methyl-2-oxoglutarate aldolase